MASEDKNSMSMWVPLIMGIIGLLATIGITVSSYSISRVDSVQAHVVTNYIQKDQYNKDWSTVCERLSVLDRKLDTIDKLLRDHERESAKRR